MPAKYFEDSYLFEYRTQIIEWGEIEQESYVILADTIFYPQGGGQPCDIGHINTVNGQFKVEKVQKREGKILHFGKWSSQPKALGEASLFLNKERRQTNCFIHTAGHMLDVAMLRIGKNLLPTKGYHFPDSPYVEYDGVIDESERPSVIESLNAELRTLIEQSHSVKSEWVYGKAAIVEKCPFVPNYLDFSAEIRIVTVADGIGCPCAGTHVNNTREIGKVEVHKIRTKKGKTRVSYRVLNKS